ncbi:PRC-barrel domain-containing protein [Falsibacillus pallidus]|uniref:Uncharacterized protein YrrD n=1 Tax=Falsibacillus pallidus TaxID=493781 RepID=A0A370GJX9_9BACI|nr:PRC-barrel domain-containing protein [Falsibacillus pallidus]RDI44092.1 uncharacterized protein YrrD [Falsibacillus pallidus]
MRTFSLINGLAVFLTNGEQAGCVCDIYISEHGRVTGIAMKAKGLFPKKYRLPIESVIAIGPDGILIDSKEHLQRGNGEDGEYTLLHHQPLIGRKTLSMEGECLGELEDVYFLEKLGTIVGYELTDGFFADIIEGKRVISTPVPPLIGKDSIIVSTDYMRGGLPYDEMSKLPEQGLGENRY